MKKLFTAKDIEELQRQGRGAEAIPTDAILTPSARDALNGSGREYERASSRRAASASASTSHAEPFVPDYEFKWVPGTDASAPEEIHRFFHSPEIEILKVRMCDMGRRIWERGYVDGNGGNLTIRVGDNLCLCTPTLISKGFMKPEEMCLVDLEGTQLAGSRKRTSECMTHLAIMKRQPKAKACCHAHPPHATAYAVAGVRPPTCMIPEAEVFLGQIGMAEYQTPGTPANAKVVGEEAKEHMSVLMLNHGVITWGKDIEDAYWKMENTDAYCQTVWMASQLGTDLKTITQGQARELIELRKSLGMDDKRESWKECELCDNSEFHPGVACSIPAPPSSSSSGGSDADAEKLVQQITDQILAARG